MTGKASILVIGAAVGLLALPVFARAETTVAPKAASDFTDTTTGPWTIQTPKKTFQFDNKGRWGLRLDVEQPLNRETDWKDVQAGAYFRLTPQIRVGGSVGLGDRFAQPQKLTPQDTAPRVHLETAFQF